MEFQFFLFGAIVAMLAAGFALARVAPRYASARPWALLAAVSIAAVPIAIILHNVLSAVIGGEEAISFIVALIIAPSGFAIGSIGAGLALLREGRDEEIGASLVAVGAGVALFGLYGLFALVVTSLEGGNPPYQAAVESVVLPLSLLVFAAGAIAAVFYALAPRAEDDRLT